MPAAWPKYGEFSKGFCSRVRTICALRLRSSNNLGKKAAEVAMTDGRTSSQGRQGKAEGRASPGLQAQSSQARTAALHTDGQRILLLGLSVCEFVTHLIQGAAS